MADLNPYLKVHIRKWENLTDKRYYVNFEVIEYEDIPDAIFVFKHNPFTQVDEFSHVATPIDLVTFPAYNPTPEYSYFRRASVELNFITAKEREEYILLINDRIQQLLDDWKKLGGQLEDSYDVEFNAS